MASTATDGIELSHAYVAMEEKEKKPSTIERLKRCLKAAEKFFVPAILLVICVLMLLPAVFYTISRFKKVPYRLHMHSHVFNHNGSTAWRLFIVLLFQSSNLPSADVVDNLKQIRHHQNST